MSLVNDNFREIIGNELEIYRILRETCRFFRDSIDRVYPYSKKLMRYFSITKSISHHGIHRDISFYTRFNIPLRTTRFLSDVMDEDEFYEDELSVFPDPRTIVKNADNQFCGRLPKSYLRKYIEYYRYDGQEYLNIQSYAIYNYTKIVVNNKNVVKDYPKEIYRFGKRDYNYERNYAFTDYYCKVLYNWENCVCYPVQIILHDYQNELGNIDEYDDCGSIPCSNVHFSLDDSKNMYKIFNIDLIDIEFLPDIFTKIFHLIIAKKTEFTFDEVCELLGINSEK